LNAYTRGIVIVSLVIATIPFAWSQSVEYSKIQNLLAEVDPIHNTRALAKAFRMGDTHIAEFVSALHDKNERVRLNAQRIIRYLGNSAGMAALVQTDEASQTHDFSWAVPIPLSERDFQQIEKNLLCDTCSSGGHYVNYIYALEIDNSDRAREALAHIRRQTRLADGLPVPGFYSLLCPRECDIRKSLSDHAFFLKSEERKFLSVNLVSRTEDGNKALFSLYVNRGPLEEAWFHVVLIKETEGWKYLSVSFVGQS
jgi:hypothetical protein